MYLCNCNGLTVSDVLKARSDGVHNTADIFACYGVEEGCGKCLPEIQEYLVTSSEQLSTQSEHSPTHRNSR